MQKSLLSFFLALCTLGAFAANKNISGRVVDTLNNDNLQFATISVLRASDSVLLGFTRSKADGAFALSVPSETGYIMMITCPGYADYLDRIKSPAGDQISMGEIPLMTREKILREFVVLQRRGAIVIKGDTTEYNADSFKVDANASVEALLKKLPGIQVDKDGQVTAQGEKVQKILVDGEEFFSDDPAVVTKNLQAKAVDKVQVFDKKSDNATFTGVDDGERIKTINLQLKDKYKRGYFGKVALGGGNSGFFENQGMFNLFRGKQKFAVFGTMANTGRVGLSYEDGSKYGGSSGSYMTTDDGDGFYMMSGGDDDGGWDGQYNGQGLPKAWSAGAHFSDKWNSDKNHINANYRFNRRNLETVNNVLTQYSVGDSVYYSDEKTNTFSSSDRHGITGLYEYTLDTNTTLKVTVGANYTNRHSESNTRTESKGAAGAILNTSDRNSLQDGDIRNADAGLEWRQKFKKKGRSIFADVDVKQNENKSEGFLRARNSFFSEAVLDSVTVVDQRKSNDVQTQSLSGNLTYTEPMSKKSFIELRYRLNIQNNFSRKLSYNKVGGEYGALDSLYSTDYDFDIMTHNIGTTLRWNFEKLGFNFGAAVARTDFAQTNNLTGTKKDRSFNNFFPSANLSYKFNKQSSASFRYSGRTIQPTVDQIQPVAQNTDPLNISVGNPNLVQEFDHSFSLRYNSYKVMSGTYTYLNLGTSIVNNDISRTENITSSGVRTYQYINVNGNYNSYLYGGGGMKLHKLDLQIGLNANVNQSHVVSYVNGQKNNSDNNTYGLGLRFNYERDKKVDISYGPSANYNYNKNSINAQNTSFWSMNQSLNVLVYLPKKFQINVEADWNVRQRTTTFARNNNVFLLNAWVGRKFLKAENLETRLSVYDIFNQNLGFSQYGNGNAVTQQSYNTIRRYGLLSVIWNFSHTPKSAEPQSDDMNMIIK